MSRLIDADALKEILDKIPARSIENADGRAYVLIRLSTVFEIIKQMPSAQPEKRTEERAETHACDLIERQAAIDALHMHLMYRMGTDSNKKRLDEWINSLPSAQPELANNSPKVDRGFGDLIERQAAIDFIDAGHLCNPNEPRWSDNEIVNFLKSRPSAQPPVLTCDGCRHVGTYDTDFPCSGCIRREKDYYEQER